MKSCSVWTSLGANISLSAVDILMFGSEKIHFDKMSRVKNSCERIVFPIRVIFMFIVNPK